MRFKIDWASLIVGRKFTVFALFDFVFEGNFQVLKGLLFGILRYGKKNKDEGKQKNKDKAYKEKEKRRG